VSETPKWERGWKCHGYWIGTKQVARVSRFRKSGRRTSSYSWKVWKDPSAAAAFASGECDGLTKAKQMVVAEYKRLKESRDEPID